MSPEDIVESVIIMLHEIVRIMHLRRWMSKWDIDAFKVFIFGHDLITILDRKS